MKKLLLVATAFLLVSCHKADSKFSQVDPYPETHKTVPAQPKVDPYPNLPRTGKMKVSPETFAPPPQAKAFCERHPEFEQC
jgi:hypothetical protein